MAVGGGMARILGGIVVRVGGRIMWFDWGMSGEVIPEISHLLTGFMSLMCYVLMIMSTRLCFAMILQVITT